MTKTSEQKQPYWQSPPNDPLGGLEYRADGEANFYTLSKPTGNWIARIQFNGELHVQEQERILNAMLRDRNVCFGDGYYQGYWDARQDSPDVSAPVVELPQGSEPGDFTHPVKVIEIDEVISAIKAAGVRVKQ